MFYTQLFGGIGLTQKTVKLHEDNQACININSNVGMIGVKHYDVSLFFVREQQNANVIKFYKISTHDQVADMLAKPVVKAIHLKMISIVNEIHLNPVPHISE